MANTDMGFWLFDGLEEEPYGLLPLVNLSSKDNATSTKQVQRIGSYQWNLEEDDPVIIVSFLEHCSVSLTDQDKPMQHAVIPLQHVDITGTLLRLRVFRTLLQLA